MKKERLEIAPMRAETPDQFILELNHETTSRSHNIQRFKPL